MMSEDCQSGGVPVESHHVIASVESFKFGEFEINFTQKFDISTESGKLALNYHDSILSSGLEFLQRLTVTRPPRPLQTTKTPFTIEVGTSYYLQEASINDSQNGFIYVQTISLSAMWYLHAVDFPNAYMIFNETMEYHWMCMTNRGNDKVQVTLERNYGREHTLKANWFNIQRGNKQISPFNKEEYLVRGYESSTSPSISLPVYHVSDFGTTIALEAAFE